MTVEQSMEIRLLWQSFHKALEFFSNLGKIPSHGFRFVPAKNAEGKNVFRMRFYTWTGPKHYDLDFVRDYLIPENPVQIDQELYPQLDVAGAVTAFMFENIDYDTMKSDFDQMIRTIAKKYPGCRTLKKVMNEIHAKLPQA